VSQTKPVKPVKVASESLAQRAKHSSEERLGKFRKSLARGQSIDDTARRKSNSPQYTTDSDKDSLRSARHSRSSSLSSEVSLKSSSITSRSKTASVSSLHSRKSAKTATAAAAKQKEKQPEPAVKKLFPRNPIQNLIRFYETSTDSGAEGTGEVSGKKDKTPVVLEDKVNFTVLFCP
jgi:hypothetical protein